MNNQIYFIHEITLLEYVASELRELETRDVDQLFECLFENCTDMGMYLSESAQDQLYNEIERQVEAEVRADKTAAVSRE